ncbi:MAG TPA: subclass B3 metallo-beta-lactamase [Pseudomonadales bacterium]
MKITRLAAILCAVGCLGADWPPAWRTATEPFEIVDGIYYVGTRGLAAYLVTSDAGHVLIDGTLPDAAAQIERNVERLGFRLSDVKILLNSHAHFDHSGGLAELKRRSGAQLFAHAADVAALEGGFYLGSEEREDWRTPPVEVDRALQDGDVVALGGRELVLHHMPGHTPGCSSWGTTARHGDERYRVLFFCSATVAANRLVGPPQYPGIADDYRRTFERARSLRVDIPLAAHPEFFDLLEKRGAKRHPADPVPFVDPHAFPALMARLEAQFERALAEQQAAHAVPSGAGV